MTTEIETSAVHREREHPGFEHSLSVVIPAFDESENLPSTLQSIERYAGTFIREVVVVDNGSTDNTVELAVTGGAILLSKPEGTIASLRNAGTQRSSGRFVLYLDADVELTEEWRRQIEASLDALAQNPMQITGSRCATADDDNWIAKYWFKRLQDSSNTYINSGHLLTTRHLFDTVSGFDESMATGEDYDFCQRATAAGAAIRPNADLRAIHKGYPLRAADFFVRERWHGSQDAASFSAFAHSRTAQLAAIHLMSLAIALVLGSYSALGVLIYPAALLGLSAVIVIAKFPKSSLGTFLASCCVAALYLWGRSAAILSTIVGARPTLGHRN